MENVNQTIGKNLTNLRKNAKLTQLELAEKLSYSDKTISKWETGESLPSIDVLYQIANMYGVTLNDLTTEYEDISTQNKMQNIHNKNNKFIIALLAISVVWILATVIFVYSEIIFNHSAWKIFIWSVPISCIIALIFNSLWGNKRFNYLIVSLLVWTLLASVYIEFLKYNIFVCFFLGIPLQLSIILWSRLKK